MVSVRRRSFIALGGAAAIAAPVAVVAERIARDHARQIREPSTASSSTASPAEETVRARAGVLHSADLMVFGTRGLAHGTLAAVRKTSGVAAVLPIALSQVSVENQLLVLASADPERFREFTPYATAEDRAVWEHVASGELAVDPALRQTIPAGGTVRLGASSTAPTARIGAWASQIADAVHLVGDRSWVERLSMIPDNGLLISTGTTSPDVVAPKVKAIVGGSVTVQRLDVVAREGLDPASVQTACVVGSVADAIGHFTYSVASLSSHGDVVTPDPGWVKEHLVTDVVPILGPVTGNRLFFPQLKAALGEIVDRGLADKIIKSEYGGCYFPRFIAGTHVLSNHAFGLAIDLNVAQNQRGTPGNMDQSVVATFAKWGFTWGGTWSYTDPMHFEINRLMSPQGSV